MQGIRQAGSTLIYAVLSIVLVLGSLSLALAERNVIVPPASTATRAASTGLVPSATAGAGATTTPSAAAATDTPGQGIASALPSATPAASYPTIAPTRRAATATRTASKACGPFPGWVKAYVVQPGDTMFHVAMLYRTTVLDLQRANCKTSFLIFVGERLWVPNVATATAGVTIIPPFFDTPTSESTQAVATDTPIYFTPTTLPTDTNTPSDP